MARAVGWLAATLPLVSLACTTPIGDRASPDRPIPPGTQIPNNEPFGLDAGFDASLPIAADASVPRLDGAVVDAAPLPDGGLVPFGEFRDPPVRFAVPPSGLADGFFATDSSAGERTWATVDLDGDGVRDLVQTADPASADSRAFHDGAGSYWRFFKGSRSGFAATPERFAVPESGAADGFFATEVSSGPRAWLLVDLDGDRRPELVQTADPARSEGAAFRDAAGSYWRVFANGGASFSRVATRFPLPDAGLSAGFATANAANQAQQWRLFDVDGNGLLDLVQTANPQHTGAFVFSDAAGVFWKRTRMLRAGDAGTMAMFASYTERFVVPPLASADGLFATAFASSPVGSRFWTTRDITGDGVADLVITADPARAGGAVWSDVTGPYWTVFRGLASGGFRSSETRIALPPSGLGDGFYADGADGSRPGRAWFVADLDADGYLELVQTMDPDRSERAAFRDDLGDYWRVYRLREGTLQRRPMRLGLPSSGTAGGFYARTASFASRVWNLVDLDGDGKQDLVQTASPADGGTHVWNDSAGAHWRVWFGE